jgi:GTP-binding protein HflX
MMKTLLIVIYNRKDKTKFSHQYEIEEFKSILNTYGIDDITEFIVKIDEINPATYIGKGKAEEIKEIIKKKNIEMVVINKQISYTQQRNLEYIFDIPVRDKTFIILEIFRQRARTSEGKLQVELALLKYKLTRLANSSTSYDQQYGVYGARGGSGEKKIEYERRKIKERISLITSRIEDIKKTREIQRKKKISIPLPVISIIGYTNAGKSTLLNSLSKRNDVYADNKLFATLDPTSRRVMISEGFYAIFSDTVGFIRELPSILKLAFQATFEEIRYSDLIIHLHDITSDIEIQNESVKKILNELKIENIPILNVFNKIDLCPDIDNLKQTLAKFEPVFISAKNKIGFNELFKRISEILSIKWKPYIFKLSIDEFNFLNSLESVFINEKNFTDDGKVIVKLRSTEENYNRILKLLNNKV